MTRGHAKVIITLFIVGLLSACGTQASETAAASQPTEGIAAPTQTSAAPALTDTAQPTTAPNTEPAAQDSPVSFAHDVLPLLESRCKNCHGGNRTEEGLILLSYQDVMNGSENGSILTPGEAGNSLLAQMLMEQKMPKRGPKLTSEQTQIIIDWINQGALNN